MRKLYELITLTNTYSYLAVAVDQTNVENQTRQMKLSNISSSIMSKVSFVESEIIEADEEVIKEAIEGSKDNAGYLKEVIRQKNMPSTLKWKRHYLPCPVLLGAPYQIYNRAKLADMDFGTFTVDGKEYPLSFVLFEGQWEYEKDTKLRRAAFEAFSKKLREYQHTIATTYQTQVQKRKDFSYFKRL